MSRIGKYLVDNHWKIAQVVIPSSVLFGFMYTLKYGTNPLNDLSSASNIMQQSHQMKLPLHSVSMKLNFGQLTSHGQEKN